MALQVTNNDPATRIGQPTVDVYTVEEVINYVASDSPVKSVNSKTGAVVLDAHDIKQQSSTATIQDLINNLFTTPGSTVNEVAFSQASLSDPVQCTVSSKSATTGTKTDTVYNLLGNNDIAVTKNNNDIIFSGIGIGNGMTVYSAPLSTAPSPQPDVMKLAAVPFSGSGVKVNDVIITTYLSVPQYIGIVETLGGGVLNIRVIATLAETGGVVVVDTPALLPNPGNQRYLYVVKSTGKAYAYYDSLYHEISGAGSGGSTFLGYFISVSDLEAAALTAQVGDFAFLIDNNQSGTYVVSEPPVAIAKAWLYTVTALIPSITFDRQPYFNQQGQYKGSFADVSSLPQNILFEQPDMLGQPAGAKIGDWAIVEDVGTGAPGVYIISQYNILASTVTWIESYVWPINPQPVHERGTVLNAYTSQGNAYSITTSTIDSGGTLYSVGDALFFSGTTNNPALLDAILVVSAVDGGGGVSAVTLSKGGIFTINYDNASGDQLNEISFKGGTGTGFTISNLPNAFNLSLNTKLSNIASPKPNDIALVLVDEIHNGQQYQWIFADYNGDGIYNWVPLVSYNSGAQRNFTTSPIQSYEINVNAVTSAKIAADAVGATQLSTSAVETSKINNSAVTTAKIADSAVTEAKIAADATVHVSANLTEATAYSLAHPNVVVVCP
jgi:hypothetical protein